MGSNNNVKKFRGIINDDNGIYIVCNFCNSPLNNAGNVDSSNMGELKGMEWKECPSCKSLYLYPGDDGDNKD